MKIFITTVLGSPAAECAHFGICKMEEILPEEWLAFKPLHSRHAKAVLSIDLESGQLRFEFPLSGMHLRTYKSFFSEGNFRVDSNGHLPEHLAKALGTKPQIIIPGLYPINISLENVTIELDIIAQMKTDKASGSHAGCTAHIPQNVITRKQVG